MHSAFCLDANFEIRSLKIKDKDELHHLKNVLRLKPTQKITLFNGRGEKALGEIVSLDACEANIQILSMEKMVKTTPNIILACAIPKRSKFETIIEKATELGVDEIIPLQTQRTEIKIAQDKVNRKATRYLSIAINAVKQCKRTTVPKIHPPMKFPNALKLLTENSTVLIPSLINARKNLITTLQEYSDQNQFSILIGPEGDFTEKEYADAHQKGAIPVTLGETILKVETAAIASIACLNFFFAKDIQTKA